MPLIYITEPGVINLSIIKKILPLDYKMIEGDTSFIKGASKDCKVLIIRSATNVTSNVIEIFPNLRHIVRVGVGVDNIDMDFCAQEDIAVYNAPGANADAVSDYVVSMMFHALRKLHTLTPQDIATWNRFKFTGRSMSDRNIGIIGFGNIGKQIFSKLQGFNCKTFLIYDPFIRQEDIPKEAIYLTSINEVLRSSDIVTLHVPLIPNTRYLINKKNLKLLSEGSILINASRGGIVNETDIAKYMCEHDLIYIADTVEDEPDVSEVLLNARNVVVTPHIASLTKEADDNMIIVALENFLSGKAMNKSTAA